MYRVAHLKIPRWIIRIFLWGDIVAQQIGSNNNEKPSGSAYVDEILQRYLPSIGSRQFHLDSDTNKGYALQALFETIRKYGTDRSAAERLWDGVVRGAPYSHVLLLPNTESALQYQLVSAEQSMVLTVRAVRPTVREVFFNLILQDKRREKRRTKAEAEFVDSKPFRRRKRAAKVEEAKSTSDKDGQSLDAILDAFADIKHQHELKQVEYCAQLAFEAMKNEKHVDVMLSLLTDDDPHPSEVANRFGMSVANVRKINEKFMRLLLQTWEDLSHDD
jgi:hypothetical protein